MAYLYYKTLGVELSTEQLRGVQNSFILRKILNTEIQKSRDYLNKLENMNLEHHTSNPLFRELRVLEDVLIDMHQKSTNSTIQRFTRDPIIRQLMTNACQDDIKTSTPRPLNIRNTYLTRTVIENRIIVLKKQLN